jgi:hypothetical protein
VKPKLYLESTVPSYYVARISKSGVAAYEQGVTRIWWEKRLEDFDVYVSEVVMQEISAGDPVMAKRRVELVRPFKELAITDDVKTLAKALISRGPLPVKAAQDAFHIAVAAIHEMHFLLTWNCRHIANAEMLRKIEMVCEQAGRKCPVICTPYELMTS